MKGKSTVQVQPYLFFDGRCEEALEFYKKKLGAKVEMMMRFKESPEPNSAACKPGSEEKIMHTCFRIGDTAIMASDGRCEGQANFKGFALSINAKNAAQAEKLFNALADGGTVQMPMTKTFFSPRFGMVADKFGVGWMVLVEKASRKSGH
jgi:PhnB protein